MYILSAFIQEASPTPAVDLKELAKEKQLIDILLQNVFLITIDKGMFVLTDLLIIRA